MQVVRRIDDAANVTTTLLVGVDAAMPSGKVAKIGIGQDPSLGSYDAALVPWTVLPPGGGTGVVAWTFTCQATPQPPSLDVRFVDAVRPTPLRIPLDQETLAPWVSEACPSLTPATLTESGWTLP